MNLPTISFENITNTYATVKATRVNIIMNEGYVFYDLNDYTGLTDEEGNPRLPYPEEISYSRAMYNVAITRDLSGIVIVPESEVPENQIDSDTTEQEEMERRKQICLN
jgi:RIO-like serine/threonine protein kinase